MFKAVPLDNAWTLAGTKLDLKAIFRRPRRSVGPYDEIVQERSADGLPLWDLTGPLPLRRYSDWLAKGYEYVTLADRESLDKAAPFLRQKGLNPAEFLQHPQLGPWNPKLYLATADDTDRSALSELAAMVQRFGSAAVLEIRRAQDPFFNLPDTLQGIEPGGAVATKQDDALVVDWNIQTAAPAAAPKAKRVRPSRAKKPAAMGADA